MHKNTPIALVCAVLLLGSAACKPKDAGNGAEAPASAPPDAPAPPSDAMAPAAARAASPVTYRCNDLQFTAQFETDHVTLAAPGKEYVLPQVEAASGAKFQNDKATFWSKGTEAVVEIDGKPYSNCKEVSASEAPPAP
ncbi:MAG: MliC family protein [Solimonas sp.]